MNDTNQTKYFHIWQQNVAKSRTTQHDMLANADPSKWDIIALQKPCLDSYGLTRASAHWNVIYPSNKNFENQKRIRSIILVNTNIQSAQVQQIKIQSSDITAIKITTDARTLLLFNVYNDNGHKDTINTIANEWETHENEWKPNPATEMIILGDFNRHHRTWEAIHNDHLTSHDRLLNPLLDLIVNMRLEMALPRDIPTLEARNTGNWTRPDNVWRNTDSPSPFISCNVDPTIRPAVTDHLPIISVLDLTYVPNKQPERHNYKNVDWKTYREGLESNLADLAAMLENPIDTPEKLDDATNLLFEAINKTTREVIPLIKPMPHTKRWWTNELTSLRKTRNKASTEHYRWRGLPDHPSHLNYKTISRQFANAIESAKANHWQEWINHASGDDIWTIHKYMNSNPTDYGRQRIPALKKPDGTSTTTNEQKARQLANTFFPPERPLGQQEHLFVEENPPTTNHSKFPSFTPERVLNVLTKVNPYKAPGPSGISNAILKQCAQLLSSHLATIYTAICKLSFYPTRFRSIHQVVLPKPGRASYELPNSYRPIALIETMAKVQSTIVAEELSYECEAFSLLPNHQFGGRPGRSTTDALHYVEQFTKNAWRKGQVTTALFLDIQAAFPNMRKDRLIANMRARNLANGYCEFIDMILTQRQIQLKFDDHMSTPFSPENGCRQGCPLSMLLCAIYNAPLIRIASNTNTSECIVGFVDDTTLLASGKNFDEAHETIKDMMERPNGVFEWSRTYNSPLEMNKLALVNFTLSHEKAAAAKTLNLVQSDGDTRVVHRIQASPHAKLLGVLLDSKLTWKAQHEKVREKAVKWTAAFKRFTRAASGIRMNEARKLYNAVAVPKISYAADLWFRPKNTHKKADKNPTESGPRMITKRLESIQRNAAISITDALRTSPGDAVIVHANLTPLGILLKEASLKSYARIASRPATHPISPFVLRTNKHQTKKHRTSLHHLANISRFEPNKMEKIAPTRQRPGTLPDFSTSIAETKEESIEKDNEMFPNGRMIYTDGSGFRGAIGAAAVLFVDGEKKGHLRYQLGPDTKHTVFEGELVAILLGLHLSRSAIGIRDRINLSIDNQATLKTMNNNRSQSAQYLIDEIKRKIRKIHEEEKEKRIRQNAVNQPEMEISLTWVAGHSGSMGNEAADEQAKTAAEFGSSSNDLLPPFLRKGLPDSLSAVKQQIDSDTKRETKSWWKRSRRYKTIKFIDPTFPSSKYIEAVAGLNRRQTSVLTQLRTGHIPLNKHLFRINKSDTPHCPHCPNTDEDTSHLLFHCNRYVIHRHKLVLAVKRKAFHSRHILSNPAAIRHTLNYVNSTGRFKHIYGDISAQLMDENER